MEAVNVLNMGTFSERLCRGGGGVHKNVSQILTTIDFSSGEISGKTLSVSKNLYVTFYAKPVV